MLRTVSGVGRVAGGELGAGCDPWASTELKLITTVARTNEITLLEKCIWDWDMATEFIRLSLSRFYTHRVDISPNPIGPRSE